MLRLEIDNGSGYVNYTSYVSPESITIEDNVNQPTLMTFVLTNITQAFAKPRVGAYVRLRSTKNSNVVATGFVTTEPTKQYLGLNRQISPEPTRGAVLQYVVKVTSDEWLLNVHNVPFLPAMVNQTMGGILRVVAEALLPNFFTYDVDDGDTVPFFKYDSTKAWSELAKEFADSLRYRYKVINRTVYFKQFGDANLGVSYDEQPVPRSSKNFSAYDLETDVYDAQIVNDCIVIGEVEPHLIREDNFIGDGLSADFQLRHKVWGGETNLLLEEKWDGDSFASDLWTVVDPDNRFQLAGALNILGGSTQPLGAAYILSQNGVEFAGNLDLEHGEVEITGGGKGIIGGVYNDSALTLATCENGFYVSGAQVTGGHIHPILNGVVLAPMLTVAANKHYRLQTYISSGRWARYTKTYRTLDGQSFGGNELASISTITYLVQIIDTVTGEESVLRHVEEDAEFPAFGLYAPVNSINLNAVMTFTQLAKPIQGHLVAKALQGALVTGVTVSGVLVTGASVTGAVITGAEISELLPVIVTAAEPEIPYLLGFGLQNQTATIGTVHDYQALRFYVDTIPYPGSRIRLRTWESGRSVARVRDLASVSGSIVVSGDDGVRSALVTDLTPAPRTSEDCDEAATAFVKDRTSPQYNGTYSFTEDFLTGTTYPITGRFLSINAPTREISTTNFIVRKVTINVLELFQEKLQFRVDFGPDQFIPKLLPKFLKYNRNEILSPKDLAERPVIQNINDVGTVFLTDLLNAKATGLITGTYVDIDLNQTLDAGASVEVRRVDSGWGKTDQNLIATVSSQTFVLDRTQIEQTFYMRQIKGSGASLQTSRRTTAIRVVYPLIPGEPLGELDTRDKLKPEVHLRINSDIRNIYGIEIRNCMTFDDVRATTSVAASGSALDLEVPIEILDIGLAGQFLYYKGDGNVSTYAGLNTIAASGKMFARSEFLFNPDDYDDTTVFYYEADVSNRSYTESREIYIQKMFRGRTGTPIPRVVETLVVPPLVEHRRIRFLKQFTGYLDDYIVPPVDGPTASGGLVDRTDAYRVGMQRVAPYTKAYIPGDIFPGADFQLHNLRLIASSPATATVSVEVPLTCSGQVAQDDDPAFLAQTTETTYQNFTQAAIYRHDTSEYDSVTDYELHVTMKTDAVASGSPVYLGLHNFNTNVLVAEVAFDYDGTSYRAGPASVKQTIAASGLPTGNYICKIKASSGRTATLYKARLRIKMSPVTKTNVYWRYLKGLTDTQRDARILYSKLNSLTDAQLFGITTGDESAVSGLSSIYVEGTGINCTGAMIDAGATDGTATVSNSATMTFGCDGGQSRLPGWFGYRPNQGDTGGHAAAQGWTVNQNMAPLSAYIVARQAAGLQSIDDTREAEWGFTISAWQFELLCSHLGTSQSAAGVVTINALRDANITNLESNLTGLLANRYKWVPGSTLAFADASGKQLSRAQVAQSALNANYRYFGYPLSGSGGDVVQFSDLFNRADGGLGSDWVTLSGSGTLPAIVSGAVKHIELDVTYAVSSPTAATNQYAQMTWKGGSFGGGGVHSGPEVFISGSPLNQTNSTLYCAAYGYDFSHSVGIHLDKKLSGTLTTVASYLGSIAVNDVVRIEALSSGGVTQITVKLNGVTVISYTDSSSAILSGRFGQGCTLTDGSHYGLWDNFEGGAVSTSQTPVLVQACMVLHVDTAAATSGTTPANLPGIDDVLLRRVYKSPSDLKWIFDNTEIRTRDLCFRARFFNLMWEYGDELELTATMPAPPAPILEVVSVTSQIITIRTDIVSPDDTKSVIVELATTADFTGYKVYVKGGPLQSIYALQVPIGIQASGWFIRAKRQDYLGDSDWSDSLFVGPDELIIVDGGTP